jgi:hypothetical protein
VDFYWKNKPMFSSIHNWFSTFLLASEIRFEGEAKHLLIISN